MQLLPNYIAALGLDPYYAGCGTSYDAYVKLLLNVVFGSAISSLLGWKVFSCLLTLPISLVRGIWLLLLEKKDDELVCGVLSCLMRYLAFIMPLINAFPLLFASQLTESRLVWQPLLGFWLLPQVWIISRPDSSFMRWSFYPVWLCLYLGFSVGLSTRRLRSSTWKYGRRSKISIGRMFGRCCTPTSAS